MRFSRRMSLREDERTQFERALKDVDAEGNPFPNGGYGSPSSPSPGTESGWDSDGHYIRRYQPN